MNLHTMVHILLSPPTIDNKGRYSNEKSTSFTALLAAGSANASVITDGTLYRMFDNRGFQGSTVDHWGFSTAGGVVTIDTLSMEGRKTVLPPM